MKYLLDTCVFSEIETTKLPAGEYCVSDITVFETFKNTSLNEYEEKFTIFKKKLQLCESGLIAKKNRFRKVFSFDKVNIKRIDEIGYDVSSHMLENYLNFLGVILMILISIKNRFEVKDTKIKVLSKLEERNAEFLSVISRSMQKLLHNEGHMISKIIYKQHENFNDQKAEILFANTSIKYYNSVIEDTPYSLKPIKHFNHDDLIKNNNIKCDKNVLKTFIDEFITINNGSKYTKQIYLAYAYELIVCGGKIEYNDIVDMNLLSAALSQNMILLTKENKIMRVIKAYERCFEIKDTISNRIYLIE